MDEAEICDNVAIIDHEGYLRMIRHIILKRIYLNNSKHIVHHSEHKNGA